MGKDQKVEKFGCLIQFDGLADGATSKLNRYLALVMREEGPSPVFVD